MRMRIGIFLVIFMTHLGNKNIILSFKKMLCSGRTKKELVEKMSNPRGWFFGKRDGYRAEPDKSFWVEEDPETGEIFVENSYAKKCIEKYYEGILDHRRPETEIKFCVFYSMLSDWFRGKGFRSEDGWKLNLFDCENREGKNRYSNFTRKEDFDRFHFEQTSIPMIKPFGLYFSNIYDIDNDVWKHSWIDYALSTEAGKDNMLKWIDPTGCKFFVLARFDMGRLMSEKDYVSAVKDKFLKELEWKTFEKRYDGVSIDDPTRYETGVNVYSMPIWDVPTWVVWDSEAISDIKVFDPSEIPDYIWESLSLVTPAGQEYSKDNYPFPPENDYLF